MIPSQRHLFDIPDDIAYLNCAYMSPLLKAVVAAGEEGVHRKARPWEITTPDFFNDSETARGLFAELINASPEDIAIVSSVSYATTTAARNLPVSRGQSLVILDEQFPSNVYPWRELAHTKGAVINSIARPTDLDWTGPVLDAITEETALAALPVCHWTDGGLLDVVRIAERCRQVGAALVLDVTQSAGAMPFDVARVEPDFLACAAYKWLLGPYTLGFMYMAPKWQAGEPLEYNWVGRKGSENFSGLVEYTDDFQPGTRRFDMGERANFALMPMAIEGLRQILEWTVEAIAETLGVRTDDIAARAAKLGLSSAPAGRRAGHYVGLRFAGGLPPGLLEKLARQKVYVSVRGDSMRVTPHLYNTDADVDRLFAALESVL